MAEILNVIFGMTSVIGLALTIHYGRLAARLERKQKEISWSDIPVAAADLAATISRSFRPTLIVTPDWRGALIAHYIAENLSNRPTILVGIARWLPKGEQLPPLPGYERVELASWVVLLPSYALAPQQEERVLIVDDFTLSGNALSVFRARMIASGLPAENIRRATLIASRVSLQGTNAPEYYWRTAESADFFFPWGVAR